MKTLIVRYTPRQERSKTAALVEEFKALAAGDIQELDLCKCMPDVFSPERLAAYYSGHVMEVGLDEQQAELLKGMHALTEQLKTADAVVVAFPMFNFSM